MCFYISVKHFYDAGRWTIDSPAEKKNTENKQAEIENRRANRDTYKQQ